MMTEMEMTNSEMFRLTDKLHSDSLMVEGQAPRQMCTVATKETP